MKGKVSKTLEKVLRDPQARNQLRKTLISGRDGRVTVESKNYTVRTDVHASARGKPVREDKHSG